MSLAALGQRRKSKTVDVSLTFTFRCDAHDLIHDSQMAPT